MLFLNVAFSFFFLPWQSFGAPALYFTQGKNEAFNKAFFERSLDWIVKKQMPTLLKKEGFKQGLQSFIQNEKQDLFYARLNPALRFLKYELRLGARSELTLFSTSKPGFTWNEKGEKIAQIYLPHHTLPEPCQKLISKKALHYRLDIKTQNCTTLEVSPIRAHPVFSGTWTQGNQKGLLVKELYKHMLPVPSFVDELGKKWRLSASRFSQVDGVVTLFLP